MDEISESAPPLIERLELGDVASTALMTLACRAAETSSPDPILSDPLSAEWLAALRPALRASGAARNGPVASGRMNSDTQTYVALRARRFDRYARGFLKANPDGRVLNLGCGFDTRFERLGDAGVRVIDLDVPEIVRVRRMLGDDRGGDRLIESSVMDFVWMERAGAGRGRPVLVLAEGLLMYLEPDEFRRLVCELAATWPGCELVGEVFSSYWLHPDRRGRVDGRLRRELGFGTGAMFRSGLADGSEMESWGDGFELLEEWMHLDEAEPKLGKARKLRHFPKFRQMQWTVRYRLGREGSNVKRPKFNAEP